MPTVWSSFLILQSAGRGGVRKQCARPHAPKSPWTPPEGKTDPPHDKTLLFRGSNPSI